MELRTSRGLREPSVYLIANLQMAHAAADLCYNTGTIIANLVRKAGG